MLKDAGKIKAFFTKNKYQKTQITGGKNALFRHFDVKNGKKNGIKNNIFERTPLGASQVPPQQKMIQKTQKSDTKNTKKSFKKHKKVIQKTNKKQQKSDSKNAKNNKKWFKKYKKQQKVIQKTNKSDLEGTFAVQTVLQLAAGKCERPKASRSQPTPQTIQ